jgi:DNA-binding PadR family transcriptional regulator
LTKTSLFDILSIEYSMNKISLTNSELAILGLLSEAPKYGYQLEQEIEERGFRQWADIAFSSIYNALGKMERTGLLESKLQSSGKHLSRRVYNLTDSGVKALHDGVIHRLTEPRPRSGDYDLALANLPALTDQECLAALESYRKRLIDRLDEQHDTLPPHGIILFDHSLIHMQCELDWVVRLISRLAVGLLPGDVELK